jgi:hypothetical protein
VVAHRFASRLKCSGRGLRNKGLDSLVPFTCGKPVHRVLYLITFKFDGEHQVLVLHMYVLPHLVLFQLSLASTESKKRPFYLNVPTFLRLSCPQPTRILLAASLANPYAP